MNASAAIADPWSDVFRHLSFVKRETQAEMSMPVSSCARYEMRFMRNVSSGDLATNHHE
jgi:hypothetical protein